MNILKRTVLKAVAAVKIHYGEENFEKDLIGKLARDYVSGIMKIDVNDRFAVLREIDERVVRETHYQRVALQTEADLIQSKLEEHSLKK